MDRIGRVLSTKLGIVALTLVVAGGGLGAACNQESSGEASSEASSSETAKETSKEQTEGASANEKPAAPNKAPGSDDVEIMSRLPDVVDRVLPGVVGISTKRVVESRSPMSPFGNHPFFRGFPGFNDRPQKREQQGMGSGVVVSEDGTIITNNHVVEGADKIRVSFSNRRQEYEAEIVGTDSATDIAVLKLKEPPKDLKPLSFGNSDDIRLGEPVVAIGNPFGLSSSVTYGIVSAKGRANVGLAEYEDFIQTDAAINPGNSGGALVNMQGELIGINTAILSRSGGYQGIGFAIPANMAQSVMTKLLETGEVNRGYLGVLIQTLTPDLAQAFDLPEDTKGVVISNVKEGGPADEAGLQQGDIVVKFDGENIDSANTLRNVVAQKSPGSKVSVTVLRDGDKTTVQVKLGALNGSKDGRLSMKDKGVLQGLTLGEIDQEIRQKLELPEQIDKGVAVLEIEPGSPAARTGLEPGDVILEANRRPIESVDAFAEAYDQANRRLLLLIYRNGQTVFLAIPKQ
jgi:serine protease Do